MSTYRGDSSAVTQGQVYSSTDVDELAAEVADILATQSFPASHIGSGTFANARIAETSVTQHEGALTITESQISDLDKYTQAQVNALTWDHGTQVTGLADDDHTQYHNDTRGDVRYYTKTLLDAGQLDTRYYTETEVDALTWDASDIVSGSFVDARIAQSNVTQHQAALSITESQISDLGSYLPLSGGTLTGNINAPSGTNLAPSYTFAGDTDTGIYRASANTLGFAAGGVEVLTIDSSGIAVLSNEIVASTGGGQTDPSYTFDGDTDTGIYQGGADTLRFTTGGVWRLQVESNGTLNVAGTANYENLVLGDDDIPNKRYVDDMIGQDLGEYLVANLPTASSYPNYYALATNASGGRTIVRSDGTNWKVVAVEGATVTV